MISYPGWYRVNQVGWLVYVVGISFYGAETLVAEAVSISGAMIHLHPQDLKPICNLEKALLCLK